MSKQDILYAAILFTVATLSVLVAAVIWRRRHAPGSWALIVFMLGITVWTSTYALFWANMPPSRPFWLNATYFGVVCISPAFFFFALQITHHERWLTPPLRFIFWLYPILTIIVLWTDPWHNLFYGGLRTAVASTIFSGGPWFWTFIIFTYGVNIFTLALFFSSLRQAQGLFRRQLGLVLLAALIPFAANIISLLNLNPLPTLDLTPLAFALTGLMIAYTLVRFRFLDVIPVARDKLIEAMQDGILVLDYHQRIIDHNPALIRLLGLETHAAIGRAAADIVPQWASLQAQASQSGDSSQEIHLENEPETFLQVRFLNLSDQQLNIRGKLLIFQDITQRRRLEAEKEALIDNLQTALSQVKTLRGLLPICANCKKIRDDQGYWQDVAVYVRDHTEAEFSHGICPNCAEALYPGVYKKDRT